MLPKFLLDKEINGNFSHFDKQVFSQLHVHSNHSNEFHTDCKNTRKRICRCNHHPSSLIDDRSKETQDQYQRELNAIYSGATESDITRSQICKNIATEKIQRLQELEDLFYKAPKYEGVVESWKEADRKVIRDAQEQSIQQKTIMSGQCYYCSTVHSSKYFEITTNPGETAVICEECAVTHPQFATIKQDYPSSNKVETSILPDSNSKNPTVSSETLLEKKRKRMEAQVKRLQTLQAKKMIKQGSSIQGNPQAAANSNEAGKAKDKGSSTKLNADDDDDEDDSEDSETGKECNWEMCKKMDKSDPEDTLICKGCTKSFHAECCDPPLEKALVAKYDWYCTECKLCIKCQKNTKEHELLMCDCCDRPFHMSCLDPARSDIPEGSWFCNDCEKCSSCSLLLFENNYSRQLLKQYSQQQVNGKIICNHCWGYYKQKKYCPICIKVIEENAEGDFVYCEQCELWLHFDCENKLSGRSFRDINRTKYFRCAKCKQPDSKK